MFVRAVRNGTKYIFLSFLTGEGTGEKGVSRMRLGIMLYENRRIVGLYYGPALGVKRPDEFDCYVSHDSNILRMLSYKAWNLVGNPIEAIEVIGRETTMHDLLTEYMVKLIAAEAAAKLTGD